MDQIHVGRSPGHIRSCKTHSHPFWEIVIPVSGCGTVKSRDYCVDFRAGQAYVTPPNVSHELRSDQDFSDIYIHLNGRDPHLNLTGLTMLPELVQFPQLGELIWTCYQKRGQGYRSSMNQTMELILQLIRDLLADSPRQTLSGQVREYILENISDPQLDMTQLSHAIGYHGDYLRREFQQQFGETPMVFLNAQRLQLAKELLHQMPIYSIKEISALCGFSDQFYFSRFFRKHTGLSPREYRQFHTDHL